VAQVHEAFCRTADAKPGPADEPETAGVATEERKPKRILICAECSGAVTAPEARIQVKGGHEHAFFNPHGVIFRIGCFAEAPGCAAIGEASSEFSWFPGYLWRVVYCRRCQTHLGWSFFGAEATAFFGLILNRLAEAPAPNDA